MFIVQRMATADVDIVFHRCGSLESISEAVSLGPGRACFFSPRKKGRTGPGGGGREILKQNEREKGAPILGGGGIELANFGVWGKTLGVVHRVDEVGGVPLLTLPSLVGSVALALRPHAQHRVQRGLHDAGRGVGTGLAVL